MSNIIYSITTRTSSLKKLDGRLNMMVNPLLTVFSFIPRVGYIHSLDFDPAGEKITAVDWKGGLLVSEVNSDKFLFEYSLKQFVKPSKDLNAYKGINHGALTKGTPIVVGGIQWRESQK